MTGDTEIFGLVTRLPFFLPVYALVLFRVGGLVMTAPVLSSSAIPARVKIGMSAVLALAMFPVVSHQAPAVLGLRDAVVGVAGETVIGVLMGLSLSVVLMGANLGGMVSGQQAGLALGQTYNPMTDSQSTVFGTAYVMVFQLVFLLAGGHRALMSALLDTFQLIPLAAYRMDASASELIVALLTSAFILGLKLAAPVLIALFLATVTLGFLGKTMPQLNILSVGFVVRAMVALGVAALALPAGNEVFIESLTDSIVTVRDSFGLGPMRLW